MNYCNTWVRRQNAFVSTDSLVFAGSLFCGANDRFDCRNAENAIISSGGRDHPITDSPTKHWYRKATRHPVFCPLGITHAGQAGLQRRHLQVLVASRSHRREGYHHQAIAEVQKERGGESESLARAVKLATRKQRHPGPRPSCKGTPDAWNRLARCRGFSLRHRKFDRFGYRRIEPADGPPEAFSACRPFPR